ncbi:MAG: hypothetical protein K5930_02830 [Treponemataceae bacterium]|nr:hypothetical protein [Treponemataceae bacterium]
MTDNIHNSEIESMDLSPFKNLSFMRKEDAINMGISICEREHRPITESNIKGYLNNLDMDLAYN